MNWFRKAAGQGFAGARDMLLARDGDAHAQYSLCKMYEFGQGVKSDKAEAYFWASLLASNDASFILLRDAIGSGLGKSQAAALRKRAAAWNPKNSRPVKP